MLQKLKSKTLDYHQFVPLFVMLIHFLMSSREQSIDQVQLTENLKIFNHICPHLLNQQRGITKDAI